MLNDFLNDDFINSDSPEEKPAQKKRRGRRPQDQAICDLLPPPTVCIIDQKNLTLKFPDPFIFLKACKHLEKAMSLEFYSEG